MSRTLKDEIREWNNSDEKRVLVTRWPWSYWNNPVFSFFINRKWIPRSYGYYWLAFVLCIIIAMFLGTLAGSEFGLVLIAFALAVIILVASEIYLWKYSKLATLIVLPAPIIFGIAVVAMVLAEGSHAFAF